jgi:MFS family permease
MGRHTHPIWNRLAIVRPLAHRDFRLLWFGQTISAFGNAIFGVALPFQVLALRGSAVQLGTAFALSTGTSLVALLFGGVIVDRVSRRRVILASDLLSGVVVAAVAGLGLSGHLTIAIIYVAAVFFGAASAFYLPAMGAIVPELVPADVLTAGNSLRGLSRQVNRVIGPLVGGVLVSGIGPPAAFAVDAATFFVSFVIFLASSATVVAAVKRPSLFADLKEGIRYTASIPWLWITIFAFSVINFFDLAPLTVGLPLLVHEVIGGGARTFGFIGAAAGVGELIATLTVSQLNVRRVGIYLYTVASVEGLAFLAIGLYPALPLVMVANALFAACVVGFTVVWDSLLQKEVPRPLLGRVVSLDWFGAILLGPAAPIFGALLAQRSGPRSVFVICGVFAFVLSLAGLAIPAVRHLRLTETVVDDSR